MTQIINQTRFFEYIPAILKPWFFDDKPMWYILSHIKEVIYAIVNAVPGEYQEIHKGVFIDKNVKIDNYVEIYGPALIGKGCKFRQGAFLRENIIIGDNCIIGNSTEIKNSVLFNNVEVPHYNYIGDSILGNYAHLGAGAKISNVLLQKNKKEAIKQQETSLGKQVKEIKIKNTDGNWINTGLVKFGAIIGDYAEIGVNATLNPGTLLEMDMFVPSSISIGGYFRTGYTFPRNIVYECEKKS